MVKRATKKQRGQHTRSIKKMIVTGLEGKNVTEKQYLNHFNSLSKKIVSFSVKEIHQIL